MELDYFVVDVFTDTALAGNPLAVVMNTCDLTTERMQQIAREFNLSETTFVERRPAAVEQAEGVRVRIFTTQEELNFAGHPTLGTASVLKLHAPETVRDGTVTLSLNVGAVPVRFSRRRALYGEMTQRDPEFGAELDPREVARLTGLAVDDLDPGLPPQIVSTGTAFAIVALRSAEALARLKSEPARGHGVAAGARRALVLRTRSNSRTGGRPCAPLPRPDAVLRRRRPGHRLGGRLRHQLPGPARRRRARCAHPRAAGRRDRPPQRSLPDCAFSKCVGAIQISEDHGCARGGQHRSCGIWTAFPAGLHTLSTGIHHYK